MRISLNSFCGITRVALAVVVTPTAAWCQTPGVTSLVNSASYQPTLGTPGTIATIFGTNLADTTATAQMVPLPYQLGGTSVTVGGTAAPLFYVSPTQINFQVPYVGSSSVVVTTAAGVSAPYDPFTATPDAWYAGGIFSLDGSGCGQGAVLNVAADGSVSLNSAANSASPGDWITFFGSGIDTVLNPPPIGVPAPLNYPITAVYPASAQFDFSLYGLVGWSGLAPGYVGLDQANFQIPTSVREGCAVPLQSPYADGGGTFGTTQPLTIAVRQGGGPCVDPPSAGYGQIVWQKIVSATARNVVSESDTMIASLQASPGKQAPPAPAGPPLLTNITLFGPACPVPGYRSLGAGTVTVQAPGLSPANDPLVPFQQPQVGGVYQISQLEPGQLGGISVYQATFPAGTVQAGKFTVTANGGADVGAFQTTVNIGADIQIQTPLAGVSFFSDANCTPLTINWTGGDPNSWVTVNVIWQRSTGAQEVAEALRGQAVRASAGTVTLGPAPGGTCGVVPYPIQIAVEIDPDPSEIATFSANGLSLGGLVTWRYIHSFQASLALSY